MELARELGITAPQLYKWRKEYRVWQGSFSGNGKLKQTPEQERIAELERKLKDAELERDILKALASFPKRSMIYVFIKTMKDISKDVQSIQSWSKEYYQWKS
jgi:transposase-like protein